MTSHSDSLGYTGPSKEYKPQDGTNTAQSSNFFNTFDDRIYQYEVLTDQIDQIIKETDTLVSQSSVELEKFTLKITTEKLMEAQQAIWPKNISEVKDYVTYKQYTALEPRLDRASKYIKDEYVKNIRGEQGSGVFDIAKIAKVINTEAKNIKGFIDEDIISDVNDSAQKRIAELFQDWSTSALSHTKKLSSFFSERGKENTSKVPESEMAAITEQDAGRYQALFKARVNALNLEIERQVANFERHFLTSSDIFYAKFLGPAVRFHKKAGSDLMYRTDQSTVLGREIIKANESLGLNMNTALTDLLQRNEIFESSITGIETNIGRQESLRQVFRQFSAKSNRGFNLFLSSVPDYKTDISLSKSLDELTAQQSSISALSSSHATLADRDDPNAHPQYILKSGDTITGDIQVAPGIRIDGVVISEHQHTGLDGSSKISGESILANSLPSSAIDIDQNVGVPQNLKIIGYSDGGQIGNAAIINANFFWESEDPNQMYEIQITKRDSTTFEE